MAPHLKKSIPDLSNMTSTVDNVSQSAVFLVGTDGNNLPNNNQMYAAIPDMMELPYNSHNNSDTFCMNTNTIHTSSTRDQLIESSMTLKSDINEDAVPPPEMSLLRMFLFGFAAPPSAMCGNILGFLMSVFLLEVVGITPFLVLCLSLSGRIWDAMSDPLVGYLVSKSRSRFGQCRPWILVSAPLAATSFFLFFNTPTWESESLKFAYFFIIYLLFLTFITTYHIPYTSMTMLVSHNSGDRDTATTIRMMFEMGGTLFGTIIFTIITNVKDRCDDVLLSTNSTSPTVALSIREQDRYRIGGIVIATIVVLNGLVGFFGSKEVVRPTKKSMQDVGKVTIIKTFKRCLSHRSYLILMFTFMLASLAIQIIQACLALYTKYSLDMKEHLLYAIAIIMSVSILATPGIFYLIRRIGKKRVFYIGLFLILPVCVSAYLCPADKRFVPQYYVTMILAGCFAGINMLLPWIMLPDVIDDYTVKTGFRDEAAFYSLYNFFSKFAVGVSQGLIQLSLHIAGYLPAPHCVQSESVGFALRIMMGPAPAILVLLACVILYFYPITPKYRKELDSKLARCDISCPKDLSMYICEQQDLTTFPQSQDKILISSQESRTALC